MRSFFPRGMVGARPFHPIRDEPAGGPTMTLLGLIRPGMGGTAPLRLLVEDESATEQAIEKHGGEFVMPLPNYPGVLAEKKFKIPIVLCSMFPSTAGA